MLEKTYANGSDIDSVAMFKGIFEYTEIYKLIRYNNIVYSDHVSYIADFIFKEYLSNLINSIRI